MGAAVGTEGKGSVNVELNIVPFIDLMSCLTAFLLVTAVWVNIAQLNIQPKGKAREADRQEDNEDPVISILLQPEQIWVGVSRLNEFRPIPKTSSGEQDWDTLRTTLESHKKGAYFKDRQDIEIAAESATQTPVKYQDLVNAIDTAVAVGFKDPGLTDVAGLSAKP